MSWDSVVESATNVFDPGTFAPVDARAGGHGASPAAAPKAAGPAGPAAEDHSTTDLMNGIAQEGLGALLDMEGMLDRQRAQRELRSRFDIVPDGTRVGSGQNQVSESQFQELARQYSDIRRDKTDIKFDTSSMKSEKEKQKYRDDTMALLADQMQTESGRALIGNLADNVHVDGTGTEQHHTTTFEPNRNKAGKLDNTGAGERPVLPDGTMADLDDPRLGRDAEGGAGAGSDARISFNPGMGNIVIKKGVREYRDDVALYHEMVHAYTDTHGVTDLGTVQAGDRPDSGPAPTKEEQEGVDSDAKLKVLRAEHQAAGLGLYANEAMSENRYREERRDIGWSGGPGVKAGDPTMWRRNRYLGNNHVPGKETSPWELLGF